jgi:RNA polymerase sigma factor (sigma-70 family)
MIVSHHIIKSIATERERDLRAKAGIGREVRRLEGQPQANRTEHTRPDSARLQTDELASLLESAAAGNDFCWEVLVKELGTTIRMIAGAHRLSEADAADVAQATWLKLLEHLEQLREPASVGAWLATTARRECWRVLRDARSRVLVGDDVPEQESREAAPGDALLTGERDEMLWRCFERLRATDQVLLRSLLADPRPAYEEIAAALAMPIGSIGPTRARALERLRQELDNEGAMALL